MNQRALLYLFYLGLFLILLFRFYQIDHSLTMQWGYVNSAAINPYYGANPPLGYRPLMPVLFNIVGYIPKAGEWILPVFSAWLMCIVFFVFLTSMGMSKIESGMGSIILVISPGIPDLLKEFGINHVDTTSHILIIAALISIIKKNHTLFSITTLLGTMNREWALMLIPAWYVYHFGCRVSISSLTLLFRISMPSVLVYWMIRSIYFPNTAVGVMLRDVNLSNAVSETSMFHYYWNEFAIGGLSTFKDRVFSAAFYQYGLIALSPFMIIYRHIKDYKWVKLGIYYFIICILQFLIAADVWRLSFYLFPIIITAYIYWLQNLKKKYGEKTQIYSFIFITSLYAYMPASFITFLVLCLIVAGEQIYQMRKIS